MRIEGWENRLEELVQSKRNQPFNWANNNCMGFVAEAQKTITGETDFPEVLENLKNKNNALKLVLKNGSLTDWVNKHLEQIPITMAQRGDIVDVETCEGPAMGLCIGSRAVFIGKDGLEYVSLTSLIRAWRM